MSYILDALRRADAERERGEVPGLQSQQHTLLPDEEAPARSRLLLWAVVGLSLALVAVLAWSLLGRDGPAPRAPMAEGTVAPATPAAPPPAPTVLPSTVTAAPAPAAAPPTAASATAAAPRATPSERRAPPPKPTTAAAPNPGAGEARRTAGRATPAASSARGGTDDSRIYTQAELPEAIRREVPKLSVGGASYSNDAASRMLIINGQIFHEGDRIAPGLELEKIRLRSAVLSFKGYRYELSY